MCVTSLLHVWSTGRFMAVFLVFIILGDPGANSGGEGSLNARKNKARRKVKNGEKSPWGQWARSIQPKFQPVRPGKEDHLKRWTRFSKLFRLDRTDPLSFGPNFPESLVEWIAPFIYHRSETRLSLGKLRDGPLEKLWGSGDFLSRRNLFFVIKFLV